METIYRHCQNCTTGYLRHDVRNVKRDIQGKTIIIENIEGEFCDKCGEIEFYNNTDSAERYADAGDRMLIELYSQVAKST